MKTTSSDPRQLTLDELFEIPRPVNPQPASLDYAKELRHLLSDALKKTIKSRFEVASRMTEEAFLKAKAQTEQDIIVEGLNAAIDEQNALIDDLAKKSTHYRGAGDKKDLENSQREFDKKYSALEVEITKKEGELTRAGGDERITQIRKVREVETAAREASLKLLQEQLNGEKQLTQLLLDREKITPLEAEKRNIDTEQGGMEGEYWNTFGKKYGKDGKLAGALTKAQIDDIDAQLRVLEERMKNLDQATPDRLYNAGKATAALDAKREEARISHELAELDEREQMGEIGHVEALQQRLALLDKLLGSQKKMQAGSGPEGTAAWLAAQAAIDGTTQKITATKLVIRDFSNDLAGGLAKGFDNYVKSVGGGFKQMEVLANQTAQSMQQSFSDFFFDAMTGKLKTFNDYFKGFISSIARALANVMAQQLVVGMIGNGASLAGMFKAEGGSVPMWQKALFTDGYAISTGIAWSQ